RGIRLTTRLTDFSGYWILIVATILTISLLACAPSWDWGNLVRFRNFSGLPTGEGVDPAWPENSSLTGLFFLGLLLPAYTLTVYDASAHAAEETVGAAIRVPHGLVRSVLVSGVFGWVMLCAVVVSAPDLEEAARQNGSFAWICTEVLPSPLALALFAGIAV